MTSFPATGRVVAGLAPSLSHLLGVHRRSHAAWRAAAAPCAAGDSDSAGILSHDYSDGAAVRVIMIMPALTRAARMGPAECQSRWPGVY